MPEKETIERAREDEREGKAPTTQAGEFVREEMEHIREGKHGARSTKQAIAIGLSKARRAGVRLPPPKKGAASKETRRKAKRELKKGAKRKAPSRRRSRAIKKAIGAYVDSLKFGGGSFCLMPRKIVREINDLCHENVVTVSTGGFIEFVLAQGHEAVRNYIRECKELGFDTIEVSTGFITMPVEDSLRLVEQVQKSGLKAKPEIGIQFGAGGATPAAELQAEGTRDPSSLLSLARRFLEAD